MLLDRIDAGGILSRFAQEGPSAVREIAAQIKSAFRAMNLQEAERALEAQADVNRRRYGKGVNLPLQGNFHPSEIMPAVVPNMKRGRLLRQAENWLFQYDFDTEGNVLLIRKPADHAVTLCERQGKLLGMLSFREEISDILMARYDEQGMLEALLEFRDWHRRMAGFGSACAEMYTLLDGHSRECTWYPWIDLRSQRGCPQRQDYCQREVVRIDYSDRRRVLRVWRQVAPEIIYF